MTFRSSLALWIYCDCLLRGTARQLDKLHSIQQLCILVHAVITRLIVDLSVSCSCSWALHAISIKTQFGTVIECIPRRRERQSSVTSRILKPCQCEPLHLSTGCESLTFPSRRPFKGRMSMSSERAGSVSSSVELR
ncbi:hypothetical protein BJ508DRAFT_161150 [Ascobolus immersus RN42]|uniref:Uncharacterized protein n=1 Tax=Ascobolus immersus RN42 TaxID=1160509 RepID=A0A3N4I1W7_ASCIM|nr:hypothetical protein BJ508DRAFT_161150 [Ascobolus immersus RN42]